MAYRLGVDVGGTFTDLALFDEASGRIAIGKVPSTPENSAVGVVHGVERLLRQEGVGPTDVAFFIHGTTVATNTLLTLTGARVALITTAGFRDVLHIARQTRPKLYDFWARRPPPLIPRDLRFEVPERIVATGEVLRPLDEAAVAGVVRQIRALDVEVVAVCLLHAYVNAAHERRVRQIVLAEIPGAYVTLSSDVLPEFREYERMSTVVINAYVMPKVDRYVDNLEDRLRALGIRSDLYIMQSNGGVITARTAREMSARTVLSGPAGGALAAVFLSKLTGRGNLVTNDMGGTSSDICLIHQGQPRYTTESAIGGYPIKLPMIDINTIGAGGGSIAWIDAGGALRVGPQSAGADPGPVCYGRGGTQPTVTDANLVLGRLNPGYFLGGEVGLDLAAARTAIADQVARPLGLSVEEAAEGIVRVVNANMVRGIRVVSVERGYDVREFALVAFGGAGPVHAADLAVELGLPEVIVPLNPGITSAIGMLAADVRHDYVRTFVAPADAVDAAALSAAFADLEAQAVHQLQREGTPDDHIVLIRTADVRYQRQAYELSIPVADGVLSAAEVERIVALFHQEHDRAYGYHRLDHGVELVNVRLTALGRLPHVAVQEAPHDGHGALDAFKGSREVYFGGRWVQTPLYERARLSQGAAIDGPAIVEQLDSTTVVLPGQSATVDPYGNLLIQARSS
ncbi:MAG: hydantoinase/oxoprolinase family protein [Chloroflexi bacterium]|nr:hydantoinase/oxoprolinase family protein [Chloroflexota bacterium]